MADPEGAADLSIVETPSYALAVVLLFFLTITFVADFALKGTRGFLERRSKKGLLVSLLWLKHRRWAHPALRSEAKMRPAKQPAVTAFGNKLPLDYNVFLAQEAGVASICIQCPH